MGNSSNTVSAQRLYKVSFQNYPARRVDSRPARSKIKPFSKLRPKYDMLFPEKAYYEINNMPSWIMRRSVNGISQSIKTLLRGEILMTRRSIKTLLKTRRLVFRSDPTEAAPITSLGYSPRYTNADLPATRSCVLLRKRHHQPSSHRTVPCVKLGS